MTPTTRTHYTATAIALHWLMAAMIVSSLSLGYYMSGLPFSPSRIRLFNYHKWLGVTILAIAAVRLLWRLTHRPPVLPSYLPPWQQWSAHAGHWLMYGLFFAVPLAGWAYSSAAGFPLVYFGVLPLPDWVSPDKALAKQLATLHAVLAYSLAAVVVGHITVAIKHGFEDPTGYLQRMLATRS
ncbi:MAG: cytochrome b [Burkholderiaceae bacterium]